MAKQAITYNEADVIIKNWLGTPDEANDPAASRRPPQGTSSNSNIVNTPVKSGYTPFDKLSQISKYNVQRKDILTVVRESSSDKGTPGTLWWDNNVIGVTLEDPVRAPGVKIKEETAIRKGEYKISLDTTGNQSLVNNYVRFPSDSRAKFRSPGVFPRVLNVPQFGGIRIHAGGTRNDSAGCLLFSKTRLKDGVNIQFSYNDSHWLTKLVYDNSISGIIYINEWEH
jgi:hypothetical protein